MAQTADKLPAERRQPATADADTSCGDCRGIVADTLPTVSGAREIPPREVAMASLENGIIPERYRRNSHCLTTEDQLRLFSSTVAVVGLGGLGGTVAEILARVGVGRLILIDGDRFEESNLNRQLNCLTSTIGVGKAAAAAERIGQINPTTETATRAIFLTSGNAAGLIAGADVAADCLDSLPARFVLEAAAAGLGIPMVSAAVAGTAGQVSAIYPQGPGLRAIYGNPEQSSETGVETITGNPPYTVWTVASIEAGEIVNVLLGRSTLSARLLILDLASAAFEVIELTP